MKNPRQITHTALQKLWPHLKTTYANPDAKYKLSNELWCVCVTFGGITWQNTPSCPSTIPALDVIVRNSLLVQHGCDSMLKTISSVVWISLCYSTWFQELTRLCSKTLRKMFTVGRVCYHYYLIYVIFLNKV